MNIEKKSQRINAVGIALFIVIAAAIAGSIAAVREVMLASDVSWEQL